MNMEVALSAFRQVLIFVGGILVGKGIVDQSFIDAVVPAVVTLSASIWGLVAKAKDQKIIAEK